MSEWCPSCQNAMPTNIGSFRTATDRDGKRWRYVEINCRSRHFIRGFWEETA